MKSPEYVTMRVRKERKLILDKATIEIGYATGVPCKWTDVVNFLIDNYLQDAKNDMKNPRVKK
ncbi:hypothetical protein DRE43_29195 [Salmonella enterica subsp. enterica serovar Java]|nr:hypothetical protein [Salmonella enterica subsp. enterica serovar Java]